MVKYQELWNEENTNIRERYDLAMERILEIPSEERVAEPYRSYFIKTAEFIQMISWQHLLPRSRNWQEYSCERIWMHLPSKN